MFYLLISRGRVTDGSGKDETGTPLHIQIPGRDAENQPVMGFVTIELAESYLARKKIPRDEYRFVLKDRALSDDYNKEPIFLVESKSQADEMENDEEGYDYERHIFRHAHKF
jgi:hypothetical protein